MMDVDEKLDTLRTMLQDIRAETARNIRLKYEFEKLKADRDAIVRWKQNKTAHPNLHFDYFG